jgi:hypothetical protein
MAKKKEETMFQRFYRSSILKALFIAVSLLGFGVGCGHPPPQSETMNLCETDQDCDTSSTTTTEDHPQTGTSATGLSPQENNPPESEEDGEIDRTNSSLVSSAPPAAHPIQYNPSANGSLPVVSIPFEREEIE